MFQEIIDILLVKKANLNAEKEAELDAFMAELDVKYQEREAKINKMLDEAGYVEPVEEVELTAEVETTNEDWR